MHCAFPASFLGKIPNTPNYSPCREKNLRGRHWNFGISVSISVFSTYLKHIHIRILLTLLTFFALPILKKNTNLSGTVSLYYESWCWFLFVPFWNNLYITKWWAKFKLECLLLICTYTNKKFIVICKPRTSNNGGEDSVKYRNRKKHRFLAAAILLFIDKIIITW